MATPTCKQDVQRFLGMVNYLARFVPHLPSYTEQLRQLLHKKVEWVWEAKHADAFISLKRLIVEAPILKFFNPILPIKVSTDASKSGLGAVLLQQHGDEYFPVAYAARAMTLAEQRYAMIEKELLGIVFACEKFHQYIYGLPNVVIENDHKPLSALFNKSLSSCPLRVQRFMLRLQLYDFTFMFTPGRFLYTADTLSRSINAKCHEIIEADDLNEYVDESMSMLPISQRAKLQIIEHTSKDQELQIVKRYIVEGWPSRNKCHDLAKPYYNISHELCIVNDIVFKDPNPCEKECYSKFMLGILGR